VRVRSKRVGRQDSESERQRGGGWQESENMCVSVCVSACAYECTYMHACMHTHTHAYKHTRTHTIPEAKSISPLQPVVLPGPPESRHSMSREYHSTLSSPTTPVVGPSSSPAGTICVTLARLDIGRPAATRCCVGPWKVKLRKCQLCWGFHRRIHGR